jgi:hypothetical protein
MSAFGNVNFFDAIRDTILMGVHQYKYKNGAFTDKIFRETPAIDAFNILIDSEEVSPDEKATFEGMRKLYLDFRNRSVSQPNLKDLLGSFKVFQAFCELFPNDAKARGMYVSPTTMQVMN